VETYTAEWGNARRLGESGITKDTLKPGDLVVVTGSPGRNAAERKLHLKGISRPTDGWAYGTSRRRGRR
jgi:thiamine monophosphate kinase